MQKLYRAALAVLAAAAFTTLACTNSSVEGPTASDPIPVASVSAPAPAPSPAPSPTPGAGEGGEANDGYLIEFENNAGFKVTNKTDIGQEYRAYITSFDNQDLELAFKVSGTVPPEESWGGSFNATCVQLDITQFGVSGLPLKGGAAFFDKNGRQFNPSRSPEKVTECRTPPPPPCEGRWIEDEEPTVTDGQWGTCSAPSPSFNFVFQSTREQSCSKKKTVTLTYYETNSCTKERRVSRIVQREESEKCDCPPPPDVCPNLEGNQSEVPEGYELTEDENGRTVCTPKKPDYCFYEVTGQDKQSKCESKSGTWENWDNEEHHNHCRLPFPGVSDNSFNLTPGQSENGCLRKQDD